MAHYNKFNKIEMEILRDGEVIGYNYYFFKKDLNNTTVTNQLKFTCCREWVIDNNRYI